MTKNVVTVDVLFAYNETYRSSSFHNCSLHRIARALFESLSHFRNPATPYDGIIRPDSSSKA